MIKEKGYIALITVLIISSLLLGILTSIPLLTVDSLKNTTSLKRGIQAQEIAKSCAELALIQTQRDLHYTGETLSLEGGSCVIGVTDVDTLKNIQVEAALGDFQKGLVIQVEVLGRSANIKSWEML